MTPLAMGLCALSGCTTGLAAAVVWLLLNLPSRVMDVFAFHGPRRCGWALALGMALGALCAHGPACRRRWGRLRARPRCFWAAA